MKHDSPIAQYNAALKAHRVENKAVERKKREYEIAVSKLNDIQRDIAKFQEETVAKMTAFIKVNNHLYDPEFVKKVNGYFNGILRFDDKPKKSAYKVVLDDPSGDEFLLIIPYLFINDEDAYLKHREKTVMENKDKEVGAYKSALAQRIADLQKEHDAL